ncbi:hypothetical protein ABW20_dc0104126 [Dactylellina cionopaga]|nr:hypothetical protein ABW20_dc0104126 [Dactylellina cionopaga]
MQLEGDGPGVAFQSECSAALNTRLEGPATMDQEGLTPEQCRILDRLTDVASRYTEIIMANPEEKLHALMSENVSTAALFVNAVDFESRRLNTNIPCGPRGIFGQALEAMTRDATELARRHLPWLTITITHNAHVLEVNLADPAKPFITIEDGHSGVQLCKPYDLVLKTTGTTWKTPVSGQVGANAYTGIPNADAVFNYLFERNILDTEGFIAPGSTIFIGGTSLSAYDFIGLILSKTKIVRLVTRGNARELVIDEDEAKRYPDLIKLFNRKDGEVCAPRHADGMDAKMPKGFDFITPEMLLSVQMRENSYPLPILFELARVITAIALDKSPACVEPDLSTEEQFNRMVAENEKFAADPQVLTETGMIRRCLISFICTLATIPDAAEHRALLNERYPLLLQEPWHAFRSLHYNAIPARQPFATQSFRNFYNHIVTSAPFPVHLLITRLYKLGVISWIRGAYEDVTCSPRMKFHLNGENANGLIAPRALTETTDVLSASILKQAMKTGAGKPIYQKCRTLLSTSCETIHVMELGIPGHGGIFDRTLLRRVQWLDTHSYESAVQLMPCVVGVVGIIEGMVSRGVPRPFDALLKHYKAVLPRSEDFVRQCNKMKKPYRQLQDFLNYARLVEEAYPKQYAEKMRQGIKAENRRRIISEIEQKKGCRNPLRRARAALSKGRAPNRFIPISHRSFEKMTPDFSPDQIRKIKDIWAKELALAGVFNHQPAQNTPTVLQRSFFSQAYNTVLESKTLDLDHGELDPKKYEITTTTRDIKEGDDDEEEGGLYQTVVL